MRNLNHETITDAVLARQDGTPDPRLKQVMDSLCGICTISPAKCA